MPKTAFVVIMLLYLVGVNLLGLALMSADKRRAEQGKWRIREAVFFIVALLGGGVGCWGGMYLFRHKTKHLTFIIGIPLTMLAGLVLYAAVFHAIYIRI